MATSAIDPHHAGHGDHHHDHPKFLAHHFDTPEQQFDSGKLGIWLFLVTEVLFFSGMFCAYAIFRSYRPDVFTYSSEFLNTTLGAINTTVLLFSSLTMAWAVRASQLEQHRTTAIMLTLTLCCAMIFLGVKAVEYSHKWSIGLNPGGLYNYGTANAGTDYPFLQALCVVPGILLLGVLAWFIKSKLDENKYHSTVAGYLVFVAAAYFGGVGLGMFLESGDHGSHDSHAAHHEATHGEHSAPLAKLNATPEEAALLERLALDKTNTGVANAVQVSELQSSMPSEVVEGTTSTSGLLATSSTDTINKNSQNQLAATFFGIYYCMTGVHAIHIIAGIGVLVWLLFRAVREDFSRQYFGPVDYVGLYWHLVDLIWIYLFPLLYLIR